MEKNSGIAMQPMGGGMSMNGEPLPVAPATPIEQPAATSATVPPPAQPVGIPMHEQAKIGAKCCGCCCDFRRAVIILDSILMVFAVMALISLAIPSSVRDWQVQGLDDDEVIDIIDESILVNNIISGVGFVCLAVPVYGALKYSIPMIGYGIIWLVASFVAQIVVGVIYTQRADDAKPDENVPMPFLNWIANAVVTAVLIYPHVGLMQEIKNGIMSYETYPREEYSCCCGPPGR